MAYSWNSTTPPDLIYMIIGNGFDLECGLQTSYGSFLAFIRDMKHRGLSAAYAMPHPVDWERLRTRNFWFKWFDYAQAGNKWVDFENEIAKVVITTERNMIGENGFQSFMDDEPRWEEIDKGNRTLFMAYEVLNEVNVTIDSYSSLLKKLLDDLGVLIECFEAYLHVACANGSNGTDATKALLARLGQGGSVRVISFNYTTVLEDMLKSKGVNAEFCYVHGTIGTGAGKNRMVLGIDEHLEPGEIEKYVAFGPFRKYNQRIYKQTDSNYMDWLEEARQPRESVHQLEALDEQVLLSSSRAIDAPLTHETLARLKDEQRKRMQKVEVIIFGHSLGITDKDILKSFITMPDARTVVYYHSEESFSSQVSNLTAILGMDEVIARTGGRERTLEFRSQYDLTCERPSADNSIAMSQSDET